MQLPTEPQKFWCCRHQWWSPRGTSSSRFFLPCPATTAPLIAASPIARSTSGYTSPAPHNPHTSRLSAAAPVTKRTPGSRHASRSSNPPSATQTAHVKAAPKRIASGCTR